jgi:hypothetical protein
MRRMPVLKTLTDPGVLPALVARLRTVRVDSPRRWGTMTPHEMFCHLGDSTAMVLRVRPRTKELPLRRRPFVKAIVLWAPIPWPHGITTNPWLNPRIDGTRPSEFERDRERAIAGIDRLAAAAPDSLEPVHGILGTMTARDWQRWAYRHTDYHLRQFGV